MQSEMTALQTIFIVWRVVTNIKVDHQLSVVNDNESVESDNEFYYAKCLLDALDSVSCDTKRRYVKFVLSLYVEICLMIKQTPCKARSFVNTHFTHLRYSILLNSASVKSSSSIKILTQQIETVNVYADVELEKQ